MNFRPVRGGAPAALLALQVCAAPLSLIGLPVAAALAQASDAQPQQLPTEKLAIETRQGRFEFDVEIADEPGEQQIGLMHRTQMPPRHGMLFDFGQPRPVAMWMRNTVLPLDMVFVRPDGTVARIAERTEPFSEAIIASGEPVSHVLELNAGISRLIGLKPGDKLVHSSFGQ